jgi:hypothetical protein
MSEPLDLPALARGAGEIDHSDAWQLAQQLAAAAEVALDLRTSVGRRPTIGSREPEGERVVRLGVAIESVTVAASQIDGDVRDTEIDLLLAIEEVAAELPPWAQPVELDAAQALSDLLEWLNALPDDESSAWLFGPDPGADLGTLVSVSAAQVGDPIDGLAKAWAVLQFEGATA